MCLFALSTTACNFDFFNSPFSRSSEVRPNSNNISVHDARKIASPATANEGFGDTPEINFDRKGMKDSLGLNANLLFADKISDEDQRFDRLEKAVQNISNTVDKMNPTVKRLAKVEQDLEELTEQLEILITQDTMTPRLRGEALQNQQSVSSATPSNTSLPQLIRAIRLADHAGKTRVVIETSSEMMYSTAMNGNMFKLNYNGAMPAIDLNTLERQSKFIQSISANPEEDNTSLIFQLSKDSVIIKEGRIPPNKDNSNHRIYIDLKNNINPKIADQIEEPLVDK